MENTYRQIVHTDIAGIGTLCVSLPNGVANGSDKSITRTYNGYNK